MSALPVFRSHFFRPAPMLGALLLGAACSQDTTAPNPISLDGKPSLAVSKPIGTTCRLAPVGGPDLALPSASLQWSDFAVQWTATASCTGSLLDGQTVEIRQHLRLHRLPNGRVGGSMVANLISVWTGSQWFRGQVNGTVSSLEDNEALLQFEIQMFGTSRDGGSQIRQSEILTVDPRSGTVLSIQVDLSKIAN